MVQADHRSCRTPAPSPTLRTTSARCVSLPQICLRAICPTSRYSDSHSSPRSPPRSPTVPTARQLLPLRRHRRHTAYALTCSCKPPPSSPVAPAQPCRSTTHSILLTHNILLAHAYHLTPPEYARDPAGRANLSSPARLWPARNRLIRCHKEADASHPRHPRLSLTRSRVSVNSRQPAAPSDEDATDASHLISSSPPPLVVRRAQGHRASVHAADSGHLVRVQAPHACTPSIIQPIKHQYVQPAAASRQDADAADAPHSICHTHPTGTCGALVYDIQPAHHTVAFRGTGQILRNA